MNDVDYTTSDLGLCSVLSMFFEIKSIDKSNPRRAMFHFKDSLQLQAMLKLYYNKEMKVDPMAYFNQIRIIKNLIYGGKE